MNGPLKTLRGFKRINLQAGKAGTVSLTLPYNAFEFYDAATMQMAVTPGKYTVWYGNSSADANLKMIELMVR